MYAPRAGTTNEFARWSRLINSISRLNGNASLTKVSAERFQFLFMGCLDTIGQVSITRIPKWWKKSTTVMCSTIMSSTGTTFWHYCYIKWMAIRMKVDRLKVSLHYLHAFGYDFFVKELFIIQRVTIFLGAVQRRSSSTFKNCFPPPKIRRESDSHMFSVIFLSEGVLLGP